MYFAQIDDFNWLRVKLTNINKVRIPWYVRDTL